MHASHRTWSGQEMVARERNSGDSRACKKLSQPGGPWGSEPRSSPKPPTTTSQGTAVVGCHEAQEGTTGDSQVLHVK